MVRYFLNKTTVLRVALSFCLWAMIYGSLIAESGTEVLQGLVSIEDCEIQLEQYYKTGEYGFRNLFAAFDSVRTELYTAFNAQEQNKERETILLAHYLEYAKLISTVYNYGGDRQCKKYVKIIDEEAAEFLKKTAARRKPAPRGIHRPQHGSTGAAGHISRAELSALYLRYADYLYTKLVLPENVFTIAAALPVLYRKALLYDPGNTEAAVKLACWHIFPANETTALYNSFIELQETALDVLSPTDQFTAYLLYSIYYMKKYNSQKGRAYLQKAAGLFPGHVLLSHLYENYAKGMFAL
ncbi:MAG: hypothetical protein P1P65_01795 [Treponema sp.]